jgi:GNAT superfamily N-acetyltransferase
VIIAIKGENMNITYTLEKKFTPKQIQDLFRSVGWVSGEFPERLYQALQHSSTVLTARDEDQLVGLVRVLDDGGMLAYMHYVLVNPAYHGQGIAGTMIRKIKEIYKDYFYIEVMPEESKNAPFYGHFGFHEMADGVPMQIVNEEFSRKLK